MGAQSNQHPPSTLLVPRVPRQAREKGGHGGAAPPLTLTPTSPQGPGPSGPLRHLGPLCPGVVLWAHVGDSRKSGQWVLGPWGLGHLVPQGHRFLFPAGD